MIQALSSHPFPKVPGVATGRFMIMLLAVLALLSGAAQAIENPAYRGKSPGQLFNLSIDTPSAVERTIMRSHLATVHPETGEGLFARAWLSSSSGDRDTAIALYRRALEIMRGDASTSNNLGLALRDDGDIAGAIEVFWQGLMASRTADHWLAATLLWTYLEHAGDRAGAESFIATMADRLGSRGGIVDFLKAELALFDKDYQRAVGLYDQAMAEDPTNFRYVERATDTQLNHLSDSTMDIRQRAALLRPVLEFAERNGDAGALLYAAFKYRHVFNARTDAFSAFAAAYALHPMAEAAEEGFYDMAGQDFGTAFALLKRAATELPHNHKVLATMSWAHSGYLFDTTQAETYGLQAIALAPTDATRSENVQTLARVLQDAGRSGDGLRLLQSHLLDIGDRQRHNIEAAIVTNQLRAGAYEEAATGLDALEGRISESWYALNRARVDTALRLDRERRRFLDENPFLGDWERRFGESLRLSVEFDVNSAVIPASAHSALDSAAAALLAPGGDRYVFLIEGHTDITGTDEINVPLSERRAQSVALYLEERHGIPSSRLRTAGFGPRHPVATNATVEGLAANRRVEIRPYGNVDEPTVAVPGPIKPGGPAFTPDGRFMAVGTSPVELWDARLGVKLHDLYRGAHREFSPNGRYLVSLSSFTEYGGSITNAVYVYDVRTGQAVAQMFEDTAIRDVSWSPFSNAIVYTTDGGYIKVFSLSERDYARIDRLGSTRRHGPVKWLPNGDEIAVGYAENAGVQIRDARTLTLKRTLRGVEWVHALGVTSDGALLAAFDNRGTTKVWNISDWGESGIYSSHFTPTRVVPHPTEPWFLINRGFVTEGGGNVALVNMRDGSLVAMAEAEANASIALSPDGTLAYVSVRAEERVDVLETASLTQVDSMSTGAVRGTGVFIDATNAQVVSRDSVGLHVWDATTGRRVHRTIMPMRVPYAALEQGGSRFLGVGEDGFAVIFDASAYSEIRVIDLPIHATRWEASDRHVVFFGRDRDVAAADQREGIILVYDKATLKPVSRIVVPLVTGRLRYPQFLGGDFAQAALGDSLIAITSNWRDGASMGTTASRVAQVFQIETGEPVRSINMGIEAFDLAFSADDADALEVSHPGGLRIYDARSGQWLRNAARDAGYEVTLADGSTIGWMWNRIERGDSSVFFPDNLRGVAADPERNIVVAITLSNELLFYDLAALSHHLTITIRPEGQWIAYSPHGEFTASEFGTEGVYWSLGDNYLPFEALRERFESPRVLQQRLASIFEGAPSAPSVPDEPIIEPDLFDVPYALTLVSDAASETATETFVVSLRVEMLQPDLPAPQIEYRHNGRVIPASRGFEEDAFVDEESNEIVGISRRFALAEGYNLIEASLVYRGARLLTERIEVTRSVSQSKLDVIRPTTQLWYFGIGVSDYEIESQNLNFAHRDALALEEQLKAQEGVLYAKVNTRVLVNMEATERNVRIALNDFLRQASGEDVIVIFMAGHGVRDSDQNLYFMTHDADLSRPYSGMSMAHFSDTLAARPINQKAILMMDICHAGAFGMARRGGLSIEDAIQQLSTGTGTVVLASSSGAQSSFEHESFRGGHGACTAARLEGLDGDADSKAGDGDGVTSIQELMSYVSRRVPEITEFNQHPTVPLASNVRDFPLVVHGARN